MPLNIVLTNEQKILVTLAPTTESGNPANLDGEPTWTVTDGDATVEVQPGGLSAYVVSGTPGASNIGVTADADLDAGEERMIGDGIAVTVLAAEAASLGFTVGAPEPK